MVPDNPVSAVLISADLDSCRDFYENKLGLELSPRTIKNHLLFECGDGMTLLIYFGPATTTPITLRFASGRKTSRPTSPSWRDAVLHLRSTTPSTSRGSTTSQRARASVAPPGSWTLPGA